MASAQDIAQILMMQQNAAPQTVASAAATPEDDPVSVAPQMASMMTQTAPQMGAIAAPVTPVAPPMGATASPTQPNLLQQAQAQYPVLKKYDYGYTENFKPNTGYLEHWDPGDTGTAPTSPTDLNALRPQALPMDKPGLEIRDPSTRPIDILGDIASHHLRVVDPVVKGAYDRLQNSMTPQQQAILQDQYGYAQKNEGESGSFDDWKERAGMPGFFRGYTFQQWPKEFNDKAYTPQQKGDLDQLMGYLKGGPAPQYAQ